MFWTPVAALSLAVALTACQGAKKQPHGSPELEERRTVPSAVAYMLAAKSAERQGDKVDAVVKWRLSVQADPTAPTLHFGLARSLMAVGLDTLCVEHALTCLKLDSSFVDAHELLADHYRNRGDTDRALEHLETVARLSGSDDHTWHLVHIYRSHGRHDDVRRVLHKLADRPHASPTDLLRWARIASAMKLDESAERMYGNVLNRWPDYERGIVEYGEFLDSRNRSGEAEEVFLAGLDVLPASREINERLAWIYTGHAQWDRVDAFMSRVPVRSTQDLAQRKAWIAVLVQHGQTEMAIRHAAELIPRFPDDDDLWVLTAQSLAEEQRYDEAAESFQRAVDINPTTQALTGLIVTSLQAGKAEAAQTAGHLAVTTFPDDTRLRYLHGFSLRSLKRWHEASDVFAELVRIDSTNVSWRFGYASSLERAGRFDRAVTEFRGLLTIEPTHASSLNYLGFILADRGVNLSEAKDMISRALEQDPENAAYLDSMGWVLYRLGRLSEAKRYLYAAIERDDSNAEIFEHAGDVHYALNEYPEARAAWNRAIELGAEDPDSVRAKIHALPISGTHSE